MSCLDYVVLIGTMVTNGELYVEGGVCFKVQSQNFFGATEGNHEIL